MKIFDLDLCDWTKHLGFKGEVNIFTLDKCNIFYILFFFLLQLNIAKGNDDNHLELSNINDIELDELEDIEISDDSEKLDKKVLFTLNDFSGNIGTSYVMAEAGNRFTSVGSMRFQKQLNNLKLVLEGGFLVSDIEIELQLQNNNFNNNLPDTKTLSYKTEKSEI